MRIWKRPQTVEIYEADPESFNTATLGFAIRYPTYPLQSDCFRRYNVVFFRNVLSADHSSPPVLHNPFVLNLPDRSDRRSEMMRQLKRVGLTAEVFPAIRPDGPGNFPSVGARGCFLSHLALLKLAMSRQLPSIAILEDDLNFCEKFSERWKSTAVALARQEWAILYAGHILARRQAEGVVALAPSTPVQCTHFMLINGWALPILIAGLETILSRDAGDPNGGPMHVDGAYSTLRAQNAALKTFACYPTLGYQRSSRSDIYEQRLDGIKVLRPFVSAARRIKRWM
jgi:glycosyl transferase family 25